MIRRRFNINTIVGSRCIADESIAGRLTAPDHTRTTNTSHDRTRPQHDEFDLRS
jgi:hypothetical protein